MTLFSDITFIQVCNALIVVAIIERAILPRMPEFLVGPKGLLIKTT